MMKIITALATAGAAMAVAMPAEAAVFTPFTVNLSATDANSATFTYTFDPGTYTFTLVKDAYTAFAPASPAAGNWTDYYKYSVDGGSYSYWNPLDNGKRYATADDAFNAYSAQPQLSLVFNKVSTLSLQVGDSLNSLGDNTGGTSIKVAAVPEAATWVMMIVGFGAVGYSLRQRSRERATVAA